ncbi:MAG: helix-turn-helix domain-containing protein, partial [Candidatus Ratteibacteria bacterium]
MKSKFYYIRDVSKILDIPSHILRYWEKELNLKIMRDQKGNRIYTEDDIERLKNIK